MKVKVNGQPRELADRTTLSALIEALGLNPDGVAVAVDRHVVPRSRHRETELADGAEVEIIRAVGGG